MEVICLQDDAFYSLIETVVSRLKKEGSTTKDEWVSGEEAMALMRIKSKATLQKIRDERRIKFSQPDKKTILYNVASINEYLEKHANKPF